MKPATPTNTPKTAGTDAAPQTRARFRQDKFSTTLHLPCFMPDEAKPPKITP